MPRVTCRDCAWDDHADDLLEASDLAEEHERKEVGHDVEILRRATDGGRVAEGQPIDPLACPRGHHCVRIEGQRFVCKTCYEIAAYKTWRWDRDELVDLRTDDPPLADERVASDGGEDLPDWVTVVERSFATLYRCTGCGNRSSEDWREIQHAGGCAYALDDDGVRADGGEVAETTDDYPDAYICHESERAVCRTCDSEWRGGGAWETGGAHAAEYEHRVRYLHEAVFDGPAGSQAGRELATDGGWHTGRSLSWAARYSILLTLVLLALVLVGSIAIVYLLPGVGV